jgi:hypothetical protein
MVWVIRALLLLVVFVCAASQSCVTVGEVLT